jgi:hypothetical protein
MLSSDRRKSERLDWSFPVTLCKDGLDCLFSGMSVNVSQLGAYIKTNYHGFFCVNDEATIKCFLPANFTGQNQTIVLQDKAVIIRIDRENEGIALGFNKSFKQFERLKE